MNDFTKEELILLKDLAVIVIHEFDVQDAIFAIKDKIQGMIEDYCEHDPHGDYHECVDRCKKCGVICE